RGARILDRKVVQMQLRLHALQQVGGRLTQADPDDVAVLACPGAGLVDRDIPDPAALRIDAGSHQSRLRCRFPNLWGGGADCIHPARTEWFGRSSEPQLQNKAKL